MTSGNLADPAGVAPIVSRAPKACRYVAEVPGGVVMP